VFPSPPFSILNPLLRIRILFRWQICVVLYHPQPPHRSPARNPYGLSTPNHPAILPQKRATRVHMKKDFEGRRPASDCPRESPRPNFYLRVHAQKPNHFPILPFQCITAHRHTPQLLAVECFSFIAQPLVGKERRSTYFGRLQPSNVQPKSGTLILPHQTGKMQSMNQIDDEPNGNSHHFFCLFNTCTNTHS